MFDILEKLWSTEGLPISQTYSADQKFSYSNFKGFFIASGIV